MAKTLDGRLVYADLLRTAATLAVIVLHISAAQIENVPVTSSAFEVLTVYNALSHWCVPVFVMLSGMFLLDPKHGMSPGKLFFHHILRILAALVVWAAVYAVAGSLFSGGGIHWGAVCPALYHALLGGTHYHLWFLYMIIGLYLVTPVLRAFVRGASQADFRWFFLLVLIFAWVLPTLLRLRPSQTISRYVGYLDIHVVMGYVGYYVLGYYLKAFTLSRPAEFAVYLLGLAGAAVTVGGSLVRARLLGQFSYTFYNYDSPNIAFFSIAVFVLFRYVLGVSDERSRRQRISGVARISFGIYLVHDLFIMLLRHFGLTALSFNPILAVPVLSCAVFLCSFAAAWLLSKLPFVGRYLT